jgi:hypothetical protein
LQQRPANQSNFAISAVTHAVNIQHLTVMDCNVQKKFKATLLAVIPIGRLRSPGVKMWRQYESGLKLLLLFNDFVSLVEVNNVE